MTRAPNRVWNEKLLRSGYFFGAVLLHLLAFLMVATLVIWKAPEPAATDVFRGIAVKPPPPPPPQPPSSGAEAANPQFEPDPVVVPVVTPPSAITTGSSAFTMDVSKVLDKALSHLSAKMAQGSGLSSGGGGNSGIGNGFGASTGAATQLTGYLIDFKQSLHRDPTGMDLTHYYDLLRKYIATGWDDSTFDPYYRSRDPVYTNTVAISTRPSEEAPKAFGLENQVQPGMWAIHYHAKVQAPSEGDYQFAGFADNILVVRIAGQTVLDAGWDALTADQHLHQPLGYAFPSYIAPAQQMGRDPHLRQGIPFHLDAGATVDLDVLIGDDGGLCSFFLLVQKKGGTYESGPDGSIKLPFFQLGSDTPPEFSNAEEHPPFRSSPESWTGEK